MKKLQTVLTWCDSTSFEHFCYNGVYLYRTWTTIVVINVHWRFLFL